MIIMFFYIALSGHCVLCILIFPRRCPFGTLPLGWLITGFQPKDLQRILATKTQ